MSAELMLRSRPYVTPEIAGRGTKTTEVRPAPPGRLAWIEVNLDDVSGNIRTVARHVGSGAGVMAVVKANAYGHGLVPVARAAVAGGAEALGVALLEEALELRDSGIAAPVLVLGAGLPEQADALVAADISQVVSDSGMVSAMAAAAERRATRARVHVKIDTGMGRVGVAPSEAADLVRRVVARRSLLLEGLATHVGWEAAEENDRVLRQIAAFAGLVDELVAELDVVPRWRHAANSIVTVTTTSAHADLVRVGLLTYGLLPQSLQPDHPDVAGGPLRELRPALSLKARVTQVRRLPAEHPVSYGGTHVLSRPSTLAIVPVGYADGYPRGLSNGGRVLIGGASCPIVGVVCMDQVVVDVTGHEVSPGDEVVLIGRQGEAEITAQEIARTSGAILHDVVSGLSARLPRVWRGSGADLESYA